MEENIFLRGFVCDFIPLIEYHKLGDRGRDKLKCAENVLPKLE